MTEAEAEHAIETARGLFPRTTAERLSALIDRVMPYPFESFEAAVLEHAEDDFLDLGGVMKTLRELEPKIARDQAAETRSSLRRRDAAAERTLEQLEEEREIAGDVESERQETAAALSHLDDEELEALRPEVLRGLGDAARPCHASKPIRSTPLLAAEAARLVRCGAGR